MRALGAVGLLAQLTFAAAGEAALRGREQDADGNVVESV
jgi:hypothetical protein